MILSFDYLNPIDYANNARVNITDNEGNVHFIGHLTIPEPRKINKLLTELEIATYDSKTLKFQYGY